MTTLTLAHDQIQQHKCAAEDSCTVAKAALDESRFTHVRYTGTEVEGKITKLFGDSKAFHEGPYATQCDLIFVDGSHASSYIKSDTEKALRMLRPGGVILWHDYEPWEPALRRVVKYPNELRTRLPLVHLQGTTLVGYRADGARHEHAVANRAAEREPHA